MKVSYFAKIGFFWIFAWLFGSALLCATPQDFFEWAEFDSYQGRLSYSTIVSKLHLLQKHPQIEHHFQLTEEELVLFSSLEAKKKGEAEYRLKLAKEPSLQPTFEHPSLVGARIAIDPGHFGGWMARLEQRMVVHPNYQLQEGTLAYLIAKHLKRLLEAKGASVFLTRDGIGEGAYFQGFFLWLRSHTELLGHKKTLSQLFRDYYNPIDMKARAEKINAFRPDISLIIHLNADEPIEKKTSPFTPLAKKNFNLVFLPGAFCKNELREKSDRQEFLRLLVTDDLEKSQLLCQHILSEFVSRLKVKAAQEEDHIPYLKNVCLKAGEGVYARNLCLTRLIHSPLCFGESLIQNHPDELERLAKEDAEIDGIPCSSRLLEIAEAYFAGVERYFSSREK